MTHLAYDEKLNSVDTGGGPAPFQVTSEEIAGGVIQLSVSGELDLGTAPKFEAPLEQALSRDGAGILINLSDCEFMDSTGIALIVRAWQRVDGDGARAFAVCCPTAQVARVLQISGLDHAIPLYDDVDAALTALNAATA